MAFGLSLTVLIIGFGLALTLVIMFGHILEKIDNSSCYKDSSSAELKTAHEWSMWGVIISSLVTAIFLGLAIFVIVMRIMVPETEVLAQVAK